MNNVDYEKIYNALKVIKETCTEFFSVTGRCGECPFCKKDKCLIVYTTPGNWKIKYPVVKLME